MQHLSVVPPATGAISSAEYHTVFLEAVTYNPDRFCFPAYEKIVIPLVRIIAAAGAASCRRVAGIAGKPFLGPELDKLYCGLGIGFHFLPPHAHFDFLCPL